MAKHGSGMNITMQHAAPGSAHSNLLAKNQPAKAYGLSQPGTEGNVSLGGQGDVRKSGNNNLVMETIGS